MSEVGSAKTVTFTNTSLQFMVDGSLGHSIWSRNSCAVSGWPLTCVFCTTPVMMSRAVDCTAASMRDCVKLPQPISMMPTIVKISGSETMANSTAAEPRLSKAKRPNARGAPPDA